MSGKERNLPTPRQQVEAAQHIEQAHQLLDGLRKRLDQHPELEEAILKLETALNLLTVSTGAML